MTVDSVKIQLQTRIRYHLLSVEMSIGNELVALLGRDGAGKTEILRSVAGVYNPEHGAIEIQNRTVFNPALAINLPASERHVGWVPNISALFPQQSVAENVRFPFRRSYTLSEHEAARRIDEVLELLELSDLRNRLVADVDPRTQYWIALARTLVVDPDVILIDQPFTGMDVTLQRKLRHDVQRVRRMINVPALVATSDLEEAYEIADRIALIDEGRLLQIDAPRKLVTKPENRVVADLVRSVNVFPATIIDTVDRGAIISSEFGPLHVRETDVDCGSVEFVIRPEHIRILADDEQPQGEDNLIHGTILESIDYGALHTLMFHPDSAPSSAMLEISVSEPLYRELDLREKGRRRVVLPPHALHLMAEDGEHSSDSNWMPEERPDELPESFS